MGRGQNGTGNRELKDLVCTTHGHDLMGGMLEVWGMWGGEGIKADNWENCNHIMNKIYFLKKKY